MGSTMSGEVISDDEVERLSKAGDIVPDDEVEQLTASSADAEDPYAGLPAQASNPNVLDQMQTSLDRPIPISEIADSYKPASKSVASLTQDLKNQVDATGRGASQGGTLGFHDEMVSAIKAPVKSLVDFAKDYLKERSGLPPTAFRGDKSEGLVDAYRRYRTQERDLDKQAQEEGGAGYNIGQFGAAAALPGSGIKSAILQGAGQGLGSSQADLTKGDVVGAGIDTSLGTGVGAGVGLLGAGINALGSKVAKPAAQRLGNALTEQAEKDAIAATGATGLQALRYPKGTGRTLLDEGIVKFGSSPEDIEKAASAALEKAGQEIQRMATKLEGRGGTELHNADLSKEIFDRIQDLKKTHGNEALIAQLEKQNNIIMERMADGELTIPFTQIRKSKGVFDDMINYNSSNYENKMPYIMRSIYGDAENEMASAPNMLLNNRGNATAAAEGQKLLQNKQLYHQLSPVVTAAEKRAATLNQSPTLGLLDVATIGASAGQGLDPMTAAASVVGRKVLGPRIKASKAVAADWLGDVLKKSPQFFGKYSQPLLKAAQRGATSLAATDYVMQQQYPEYNKMKRDLENSLDDEGNMINGDNVQE